MQRYLFPVILFLLLSACKPIEPAVPQAHIQSAPPAEQPSSVIVLPVQLDLTRYYYLADEQVPFAFDGKEQQCEGVSYEYHFERDPLKLQAEGMAVDISVSGKYRIRMNYCPECVSWFSGQPHCAIPRISFSCGHGEPMRRIRMHYRSQISLTENYGISTHTKLTELKAIDPCEVTIFSFDATGQLLKEVRKSLETLAKDIDKQTSSVSFRKEAEDLWSSASGEHHLPGYGYVQLRPEKMQLFRPVIRNNVLQTALVLEARPFFSTHSGETVPKPLPPLSFTDSIPGDSLLLTTDLHLQYDSLTTLINRYIRGTTLHLKKHEIVLDSMRITGASDKRLIFRVSFSGDKRGHLFVTGQPVFNADKQQIELVNTDFDLETKSMLLRTAEWLFSDRILDEITKNSRQDLGPQLNTLLVTLNQSLRYEQDDFLISGILTSLKVEQVYPETDRLMIRIRTGGRLHLTNIRN